MVVVAVAVAVAVAVVVVVIKFGFFAQSISALRRHKCIPHHLQFN